MEEYDLLNYRQKTQANDIAELAVEFGKFDQSSMADGAHYAPADANPFKGEGLMCQNCVFFDETANGCQVVSGMIEPEAICKLWVIPETSLIASRSLELKKMKLNLYVKEARNAN
jgi:hypothetical protein